MVTPYREFMQWIKWWDTSTWVTDEYRIPKEELKGIQNNQLWDNIGETIVIDSQESLEKYKQWRLSTVAFQDLDEKNKNVTLGTGWEQIYELFSEFNLTELQSHSALLDVTTEYPDKYFEYYDLDLTLYIFPTKSYKEVKQVFDLVQDNDIYTVNEVDNFWDESFYINLTIDDWYVRVVISSDGTVFWLKISKNQYTTVKEKLNQL